jgi:hypothetical protein
MSYLRWWNLDNFSSFPGREETYETCELCGLDTRTDAFGGDVSLAIWTCRWMLLGGRQVSAQTQVTRNTGTVEVQCP